MSFDLIIFDCDGVLVDSEPASNRILSAYLNDLDIPVSYEDCLRDYTGLSLTGLIEKVERSFKTTLPADFKLAFRRRTNEGMRDGIEAIAGVEVVIDRIDQGGLPKCVASSGPHEKMRLTLTPTGLWSRFDPHIFSATQVSRGKPAPDLFLFAAQQMGVPPARCAVIEDSIYGVLAACEAGMSAFGYGGSSYVGDLAGAGAQVFGHMDELPALLALE